MNSSKAIASIHWRSSRHLLLCPGVLGLGTTRWVLFFLERTSAAKQAAKSRTKSTGDSQTIFALTLCFGELQWTPNSGDQFPIRRNRAPNSGEVHSHSNGVFRRNGISLDTETKYSKFFLRKCRFPSFCGVSQRLDRSKIA